MAILMSAFININHDDVFCFYILFLVMVYVFIALIGLEV